MFLSKTSQLEKLFEIDLVTIILACSVALFCFISYLWPPKKMFLPPSLIIYLLLTATIGSLIIDTGGLVSPFMALIILVIVFSDVFGLWGAVPVIIGASAYTVYQYINNRPTSELIVIIGFSALLPLIISFVIWHNRAKAPETKWDQNNNKSYHNLANQLSEVSSKSEVVINAIGDGVIAIDNAGTIQIINPAAQIMTGWAKQDALSLNYKSVLPLLDMKGDAINISRDPISQALNTNTEFRTSDLTLVTKSGKKIMVSLVSSPVSETSSGVIVVLRDITKEKAEEREQAEFISTASHEMRTPVASIEGYLGLAINPNTAQIDDRARDYIMKAHGAAEHLGRLFQDLLDVSKADDGRISNNPTIINVGDFVQEITQGLEQKAIEKGLKLKYVPKDSLVNERIVLPEYSINLDKDHVREAVENIIENAIKYTITGEVVVDVGGDDDHVTISVKDSGLGIPSEDMPHLFQKFYRVSNVETNSIGGTGLGLYLSRRLVEIMGGRIWAESEYKKGSTFYIQLPRINNQEATNIALSQPLVQAQQVAAVEEKPSRESSPVKSVPRGESLTKEQIAAYVAKQSALANSTAPNPVEVSPASDSIIQKQAVIPDEVRVV
ncbi:MAG: ATP-binding protein [Candidatus Saccharibacteria bacterium]